jgi:hypothetical protein
MRTVSAAVAVLALFLSFAFPLVLGGVIFALFLFFPLFLLSMAGVLDTVEDRTVRQHDPSMDPSGWRRSAARTEAPGNVGGGTVAAPVSC